MIRILLKVFVTLLVALAYTVIFIVMVIFTFRKDELIAGLSEVMGEFNEFWLEPKE